ncbi:MAG: TlpA disulfide reductase family protein [Bacteroidota bacterium]
MIKYPLTIITLLFALSVSAQKKVKRVASIEPAAVAVVKVHIANNTKPSLDYYWFDLIGYTAATAQANKAGDFILKFKIDNQVKETIIYFDDDCIKLDLIAKDTITLSWDADSFNKTLSIKANKALRTAELYKGNELYHIIKKDDIQLRSTLRGKTTDSLVYTKINALYNKAIDTLLRDGITPGIKKTAVDVYFGYINLLNRFGLLSEHDLYIINQTEASRSIPILNTHEAFRTEQKDLYKTSRTYRDFIFNFVRLNPVFNLWKTRDIKIADYSKSPAWKECHAGFRAFHNVEMREWYMTRCIIGEAFQFGTFDDADTVYRDFAPMVKTPVYADTLKKFYAAIKRLKPGSPAPIFTLKDDHGKQVSLSDFKDKVVYIDFWGVYCGPCIGAIKQSVPALHQKYKGKDVVFINICIDTDENNWKVNLKKLNLDGVNLIAQGGTLHPVSKAYNIDGIPHYYLIDKEGKIADNKAADPFEQRLYDQIDKLLR